MGQGLNPDQPLRGLQDIYENRVPKHKVNIPPPGGNGVGGITKETRDPTIDALQNKVNQTLGNILREHNVAAEQKKLPEHIEHHPKALSVEEALMELQMQKLDDVMEQEMD